MLKHEGLFNLDKLGIYGWKICIGKNRYVYAAYDQKHYIGKLRKSV